jgi:hypothetical protein
LHDASTKQHRFGDYLSLVFIGLILQRLLCDDKKFYVCLLYFDWFESLKKLRDVRKNFPVWCLMGLVLAHTDELLQLNSFLEGNVLCVAEASKAACLSRPCLNGGTCRLAVSSSDVYTCACPPTFEGKNCQS